MTFPTSGRQRRQSPAPEPDSALPTPAGEVVELRVHGVHGTSPQSMLGLRSGDIRQVAGDGLTGVFRARPGVDLPGRDLRWTKVSVEAYSWGALTSGVRGALGWVKRALWLLLLPFALANLSYWARLRLHEDSGTARWGARASRLGALLLTIFMILTPCLIGIDLVGWQCYRGDSPGCSLPGALDFMAGLTAEERLALGCVVPLAVIGLLWALSHATLARYEACTGEPIPAYHQDVLRHPRLWRGVARTRSLQQVHLAVALAVVIGFSGVHVLAVAETPPTFLWFTVLAAAAVAGVAAAWSLVMQPDDVDYFPDHTSLIIVVRRKLPRPLKDFLRKRLPLVALLVMIGLTGAHLVALLTIETPLDVSRDFVGHNLWFIGVFVALTAVHLSVFTGGRMPPAAAVAVVLTVFALAGLAVAIHLDAPWLPHGRLSATIALAALAVVWSGLVLWHFGQRKKYADVAWNGAGASVVLASAVWVALLFTTGVVTGAANYLNGGDHGVADLISSSDVEARAASLGGPATARGSHGAGAGLDRFEATGEVTADHAIVTVDGTRVVVVAGSVTMTSLLEPPSATPLPAQRTLARALDSTRVTQAQLLLPDETLQVADSCVRSADLTHPGSTRQDTNCTAEDDDFVPAGALPVAGRTVLVVAQGSPVTLTVTDRPARPLVVPQVLIWSPIIQLVWLVLVGGFVGIALLRFRRTHDAVETRLQEDEAIAERDRPAAFKARRTAAFAHRAERLLDGIGSVTAFLALALIALSSTGKPPWDVWEWTRHIATLSMYVALLLGLGLLFVGSQIRTSESARRGVGVLWDLTTFWPRAAHPLAPPCYAERVVPELHTRLDWALHAEGSDDNIVILSGHSQGSAIVTAVASRLTREDLARVRVVTYGSQIRSLYGRVFPQVLGHGAIGYRRTSSPPLLGDAFPDAGTSSPAPSPYDVPARDDDLADDAWATRPLLDRVFLAGGDWANLFRRTDPLGFRVFSDTDDDPDHWVPEVPAEVCGDPGPTVLGHSGYQHSLTYRRLVAAWTGEPVVDDARGTRTVPTLPEP